MINISNINYNFPNINNKILLLNEDSITQLKLIPNESIDLIVTDPPYRVTPRGNTLNHGMLQKEINMKGKVFKFNNIDCVEYAPEFYRILKEGSHCYVMTNHVNLIHMLNAFTASGFHFIKSLIWDKGNKILGTYYMSQFEYILFFRKGKGIKINNCGTSDILRVKNIKTKNSKGENLHDTEKPVELMEILVDNSSKKNQIVLDPFMGIGSTGIACSHLDRFFIGIEIDENYYTIAKNRINNFDY